MKEKQGHFYLWQNLESQWYQCYRNFGGMSGDESRVSPHGTRWHSMGDHDSNLYISACKNEDVLITADNNYG